MSLLRFPDEAALESFIKRLHVRIAVAERLCDQCGKPFKPEAKQVIAGNGRYCSPKCRGLATRGAMNPNWKPKVQQNCVQCEKPFEAQHAWVKRGRAKFCSKSCADESRRVTTPPCETCGKPTASRQKRFCGRACSSKAQEKKIHRKCETCGAPFTVTPSTGKGTLGRFCSMSCVGAEKSKNPHLTHNAKGGRRADLGNLYFRSRWEANYARYLNWLMEKGEIAGWEFEPKTFEFPNIKRGMRFYTPDFKVFAKNGSYEYHEVKGYLTADGRTKLRRMARHFPNEPVILIAEPQYRAMAKQVAKMLPHWESAGRKGLFR